MKLSFLDGWFESWVISTESNGNRSDLFHFDVSKFIYLFGAFRNWSDGMCSAWIFLTHSYYIICMRFFFFGYFDNSTSMSLNISRESELSRCEFIANNNSNKSFKQIAVVAWISTDAKFSGTCMKSHPM